MERTARKMVGSALLQGHEVTHDIHDLSRVQYLVYRLLRNHILLLVHLFVFDILHLHIFLRLGFRLFTRKLDLILVDSLLHLP